MATPKASVVIAAHNEARVIGRLLDGLVNTPGLEIIVVCNGCTDGTEDVARANAPMATVLSSPMPSKSLAQRIGDAATTAFPRLYIDADVIIDPDSVKDLIDALDDALVQAAAPSRLLQTAGAAAWVRGYYRIWERLPQVQEGLFGRGVIAMSASGYERIRQLPHMMSDDLVMSEAFLPCERRVVSSAMVTVTTPRTVRDLVRRRTRVVAGSAQAAEAGLRTDSATTSIGALARVVIHEWRVFPSMVPFLATTAAARLLARRQVGHRDFETWGRDESSRK